MVTHDTPSTQIVVRIDTQALPFSDFRDALTPEIFGSATFDLPPHRLRQWFSKDFAGQYFP